MLLMVDYTEANSVYRKHHDESKESSYLQYYDTNRLCAWAVAQKCFVGDFTFKKDILKFTKDFITNYFDILKFTKDFITNYFEDSNEGYILEKDVKYPKTLHDFRSDLPFLPERIKINKCSKQVCNFDDKKTVY